MPWQSSASNADAGREDPHRLRPIRDRPRLDSTREGMLSRSESRHWRTALSPGRYVLLVDDTGRLFREGKAAISAEITHILQRLGISAVSWQFSLELLRHRLRVVVTCSILHRIQAPKRARGSSPGERCVLPNVHTKVVARPVQACDRCSSTRSAGIAQNGQTSGLIAPIVLGDRPLALTADRCSVVGCKLAPEAWVHLNMREILFIDLRTPRSARRLERARSSRRFRTRYAHRSCTARNR